MPNLDGSRAASQLRRALGTSATHRRTIAPAGLAAAAAALTLGIAGPSVAQTMTPAAGTPEDATLVPRVPGTTNAASPFKADRPSSEPLGLFPNQSADPFTYPAEPIVLEWSPVPGAVTYKVEVSSVPGMTAIVWTGVTDQIQVAPELLLPDGQYWWRVTATDKAGTNGRVSSVATFAKEWPGQITGGVLSASPALDSPATSLVRITPYMRWDHTPGAAYYSTEISAGDQFAERGFSSENYPVTNMTAGVSGVLPDDGYMWRVRAFDANKNPGPWTSMGAFTKAWVSVNVTSPADGATTHSMNLSWEPVSGAEKYEVQISSVRHVWQGTALNIDALTGNTALTPTQKELAGKGMAPGTYFWRVRPIVSNVYGTWSKPRSFEWVVPGAPERTSVPVLTQVADSTSALSPTMSWTPVTNANIYRLDIATDEQFNNIVLSEHTRSTSFTPRTPLPDNQVREGYFWRVVWGSGYDPTNPQWLEDESRVPVSKYRKQTSVTLGSAASGVVTEPPVFTWADVPGAARYQVQLSRDQEFNESRSETITSWSLGTSWIKDKGKRLPSGRWFWRVRAVDADGKGQTWSSAKEFILNPPRVTVTAPNDGAVVVGSPLMKWNPQIAGCAYQVQTADNEAFQKSDTAQVPALQTGGGYTPGGEAPVPKAAPADGAVLTPQTAFVPNGAIVSHPGQWLWRVRTQFCGDDDYSAWSPAHTFVSVRPPQFNLNAIPNKVAYGTKLVIAGRLKHNGANVRKPRLVLEQRVWPKSDYTRYGTVTGRADGRFAFRLPVRRSASWRLRWVATADHPEGVAPFVVRATPRVSFALGRGRMVRTGRITAKGTVFPRRTVQIQVRDGSGWRVVKTIRGARRFKVTLRPKLAVGNQRVRLFVPVDARRTLEATPSRARKLFVYDKFVVRR